MVYLADDRIIAAADSRFKKGYAIVFDLSASGVVYFDQAFDITEDVVKRYNDSEAPKK